MKVSPPQWPPKMKTPEPPLTLLCRPPTGGATACCKLSVRLTCNWRTISGRKFKSGGSLALVSATSHVFFLRAFMHDSAVCDQYCQLHHHDKMCAKCYVCYLWWRWASFGRRNSIILVFLLSALQNSSVLSTKLSALSIEQQMVSLPKSVDWLLKKLMFAYFAVCSEHVQLGQKINAVTGLYIK